MNKAQNFSPTLDELFAPKPVTVRREGDGAQPIRASSVAGKTAVTAQFQP